MANAAIVNTVTKVAKVEGLALFVFGTLAVGASPLTYATGGITIPFTDARIKSSEAPIMVIIQGLQGTFIYQYDIVNSKLRIFIVSTQAEIANGVAIDALISGDSINYLAIFGSRSLI